MSTEQSEPRTRLRPVLIWSATAVLATVMIAMFATRFGSDPRIVDSPLIGAEAAPLELQRLDGGETFRLDEFQGQVVVVNFWASWCVPCRAEHGYLTAANRAYRDRGVRFVGVVHQDSETAARAFLDELGWGEDYVYVLDPDSGAAVEFGVFGVPETFFIDRDGVIAAKIAGPVTDASLTGTLDRILGDA
ncbi:MAG TPA: TlpA disulfide reductase family protein [Acidimicrobiia bacterium]|nr:TlpA disulfide reductase family protein [Acidimicrobiia bacterium]